MVSLHKLGAVRSAFACGRGLWHDSEPQRLECLVGV